MVSWSNDFLQYLYFQFYHIPFKILILSRIVFCQNSCFHKQGKSSFSVYTDTIV